MIDDAFAIILGGGPAGCAAAIQLARAGHKVVILERSRYEHQRVGELLPPGAKPHLHRLGAWPIAGSCIVSPGIVSTWGDDEPYENDFVFNPYGAAMHLDRRQFDRSLADTASECGSFLYTGIRAISLLEKPGSTWEVDAQDDSERRRFRARFLIDATGRLRVLSRRLGVRSLNNDRLVGMVFELELSVAGNMDHRMWLEAEESGWWYSAVLPNRRMVVAHMTDSDLLRRENRSAEDLFLRLDRAPYTKSRFARGCTLVSQRVMSARSYLMQRVAGMNWAAVGDAAMAWDPISGQGITKALESGCRAAKALLEADAGNRSALSSYAEWITASYSRYRSECASYYRAEIRWKHSPFWMRRNTLNNS